MKPFGWTTNLYGPPDGRFRGYRHGNQFDRLCEFPSGPFGLGDLFYVVGSKSWSHEEAFEVWERTLVYTGCVDPASITLAEGKIDYMNITVFSEAMMIESPFHRIDEREIASAQHARFKVARVYEALYREYTLENLVWTGQEWGDTLKRVLEKCGGDPDKVIAMAKRFFELPPEWRPGKLTFIVFAGEIDRILADEAAERKYEQMRASGAVTAAARKIEPTAEEDAAYKAESERIKERNRKAQEILAMLPEKEKD